MSAAVSRSAGQAPLRGVRVLELGSTIAGPSAGRHLADLGAEVIKVEQPEGDQLRTWGELAPDGTSWWFKSHNRNKQLLTFDLRKPDDIATVRKIALSCDVVLENFRPGWLEERGLGPRSLREQKPELIFVSISGYGQTGPYATSPTTTALPSPPTARSRASPNIRCASSAPPAVSAATKSLSSESSASA